MRTLVVTLTAATLVVSIPLRAPATGIPVFDASNLSQNLVSALNAVRHTLQQAQQYATQVQQYQTQLRQLQQQLVDAARPEIEVYQAAQQTLQDLQQAQSFFQSGAGLEGYLNQYRDLNYYRSLSVSGYPNSAVASQVQKQTNDAWVKGLVAANNRIKQESTELDRLNDSSQRANGAREALEAGNQYAAAQTR